MTKDQLRIVAPFHANTGYGHMARYALHAALLAGYDVQAVEANWRVLQHREADMSWTFEKVYQEAASPIWGPQETELNQCLANRVAPDAPNLRILIPPNLGTFSEYGAGPVIGWTMTESDDVIDNWKHHFRCVDLLLAPSTYSRDTFRRVAPDVQTDLLPIPVDDRLWTPDDFQREIHGRPKFLFFSAFTTSERKNWRMMIQAFAEEFAGEQDDVGLLLKPSRWPEVELMASWCREMGAWVYVDNDEKTTDWTFASYYRACDIYLQPSSEGFGLGTVEAGMCGKPSIALDKSGSADVVNEENGYLIPSHMAPIVGHMPQWYPRTHKLATCDIDDLKRVMRRAYEQEDAGIHKGPVARADMLARFAPSVIAPKLRDMVEKATAIHAEAKVYSAAPPKPRWATAAGAWGDVMCCIGNIHHVMRERRIDEIGVIFCGKDKRIAEWIQEQPWCREVVWIGVSDKSALDQTFARLCQCRPAHGQAEFRRLASKASIPEAQILASEIAYTHLTMDQPQTPRYWRGARLSPDARLWAHEQAADIPGEFILLNPISVASNKMRDHWHLWSDAIVWLLDQANCPVVLVGEEPIPWTAHPNLINLSGQTRTMQDVLALAEESAGIVSTSNNLGIYAPLANIPSVIACARTCDTGFEENTFYFKWMQTEPISLVRWGGSMEQFQSAVRKRFGRLMKPEIAELYEANTAREAVLA